MQLPVQRQGLLQDVVWVRSAVAVLRVTVRYADGLQRLGGVASKLAADYDSYGIWHFLDNPPYVVAFAEGGLYEAS